MLISVVSEAREERWTDNQGKPRSRIRFIVKELFFLESKKTLIIKPMNMKLGSLVTLKILTDKKV